MKNYGNHRQRVIVTLLVVIALFAPPSARAIELSIPTLDGTPSDNLTVPVLVKGFVEVAGLQISVRYDSMNLIIDSLIAPGINNPIVNIGIVGQVHVIKVDFQNPITLPDDDVLFNMYFHVAADASGDATIEFFEDRFIELVNTSAQPFDVSVTSGSINIIPTDADDSNYPLPMLFELGQNYPNPFNPSTTIAYTVDKTTSLTLEIYTISGRKVDRIDLGRKNPGVYTYRYFAVDQPSGVYLYRLAGADFSQSRQMILLK